MTDAPEAGENADRSATRAGIVELVFQNREGRPGRRIAGAAALAAGVYGLLAMAVFARSAELAVQLRVRPANEQHAIQILPPPPAPPPPVVRSVTKLPAVRTMDGTVRRTSAVAPAQAAPVITRAAPDSPLDLTAITFATGGAAAFPGGVTVGAGRSGAPVAGAVDLHAPPARRETIASPDRSRPVALADGAWNCPWPAEADAEQIDEQTVVIRVRVHEDGGVDAAEVLSDPGHGFGSAATTCARRTRFQSARNGLGAARAAWSPPIRVHFSR